MKKSTAVPVAATVLAVSALLLLPPRGEYAAAQTPPAQTPPANPYGVAFVPEGFPTGGKIAAGDVLVSNFNNSGNLQGEGTTIIQLTPRGPLAPPPRRRRPGRNRTQLRHDTRQAGPALC